MWKIELFETNKLADLLLKMEDGKLSWVEIVGQAANNGGAHSKFKNQ